MRDAKHPTSPRTALACGKAAQAACLRTYPCKVHALYGSWCKGALSCFALGLLCLLHACAHGPLHLYTAMHRFATHAVPAAWVHPLQGGHAHPPAPPCLLQHGPSHLYVMRGSDRKRLTFARSRPELLLVPTRTAGHRTTWLLCCQGVCPLTLLLPASAPIALLRLRALQLLRARLPLLLMAVHARMRGERLELSTLMQLRHATGGPVMVQQVLVRASLGTLRTKEASRDV